ncbi:MAG: hypothetical protein BWK76_23705 [Desulfobulbaceae bacterium A2]|nr:MAG: hypothetical protein BWK76_23705 [Desulfobulbaceae bacterium A2]
MSDSGTDITPVNARKEREYLRIFQQLIRMISMARDHQQVMETVVRNIPEILGLDAASIRLLDSSTNTFVLGAAHGLSLDYLSRDAIDSDTNLTMVRAGKPVVSQYDNEPSAATVFLREGIVSVLSLPILFQDSIIGIMRLLSRHRRDFTEEEISFAMALAEEVGIAILHGRIFNEMENQIDFIREVQRIARLLNASLNLGTVLETIVHEVPTSMGKQACVIHLFKAETNQFELAACHGLDLKGQVQDWPVPPDPALHESSAVLSIYDLGQDPRAEALAWLPRQGLRSLLAVPIVMGRETIGVLRVLSAEPHCFTSSEVHFVQTVAEAGAVAIHNARTHTKIQLLFNQIEENERFLSAILGHLHVQLLVVDHARRVVMANKALRDNLGLQEEDILGRPYASVAVLGCDIVERCPVEKVFTSGAVATQTTSHGPNGEDCRWFERTASPIFDADGTVEFVIETVREITAQRRLEQETLQRTKLEGVLETAGAVAHEINSPLFAALGTAQLMLDEAVVQGLAGEVETIIRNLKVIGTLTKKMSGLTSARSTSYVGSTRILDLSGATDKDTEYQ